MVFTWSALILSSLVSIVASITDVSVSIFLPAILLTLILSSCLSKDVVMEERLF